MSNLTASVVVTCFAEGPLVLEVVRSATAQGRAPGEVIVVNDGSADPATNQACRALEDLPSVRVVWLEKNGGTSVARNAGFEAARFEIVVPLDADDLLPTGALTAILQAFEATPNADFVYGEYLRQDVAGEEQIIQPPEPRLDQMLRPRRFSLSTRWALLGTTPLRRALWQRAGGYDPAFGVDRLHDVDFWIRALGASLGHARAIGPVYVWRKCLGHNSARVTPAAWGQLALKHLGAYQAAGLDYRAYELLLLGAKWARDPVGRARYAAEVRRCILSGRFGPSTLVALAAPGLLVRSLAARSGR